ncbi:hypothetical protein [Halobacillus karajensis]|uniref:Uncharacterized protein n=1 Tax=Halobacillus karajensis TaxID=195088 RepID=A0A024P954_9BACI|nr:hypothetical protein [Halobacillus karajensis]CDQ20979.1 hypothetical protein BN982_03340 [Halobacillus karajensis]CDQ24957.1 hypothetical protein BN983_03258 [Halobacillus karajensis]CDQ28682.1 hypothetical protein BN981_02995 [Halobacillus karajensis]
MKLDKRLKRIEERVKTDNLLPVVFVNDKTEIEAHRERMGKATVVFIDDIWDEYD